MLQRFFEILMIRKKSSYSVFQIKIIRRTYVNMCAFQVVLLLALATILHAQTCGYRVQKSNLCVEYGEITWGNSIDRCVSFTGKRLLLTCAGIEREKVLICLFFKLTVA